MADVDLDKLSPELRAALEKELAPKPERRDRVDVNFVYDPDDAESVKKGYQRGHLTADDLTGWGYVLEKLGLKAPGAKDDGGDDKDGGDGKDDGGNPPDRRGYFGQ